MEELHYKLQRHALDIIKTASSAGDINSLSRTVLDALCETLCVDKALFILPDTDGKFTDFRARNVEQRYQKQFKEYYHQYDPFNLIPGDTRRRRVVRAEDIVSYPSFLCSEYYNDFLRPQQIYHKTVVYLKPKEKMRGMIALLRPKAAQGFSREDVMLLRAVSPYIAHVLEDLEFRESASLRDNIFKAVEAQLSDALILLDESCNLLYANQKAEELCKRVTGSPLRRAGIPAVPLLLLQDCLAIRKDSKGTSTDSPVLPRYRVVKDQHSRPFSLHSRMLPKTLNVGGRTLFAISIEEIAEENQKLWPGDKTRLRAAYGLSEREVEIVYWVSQGLRNSEIADRLFICEITVKKHIQNIFDKMGVQSRSALIHNVLTSDFS